MLDSGKTLTTIFITHDHPDRFFNVDAIMDAFPNARGSRHRPRFSAND